MIAWNTTKLPLNASDTAAAPMEAEAGDVHSNCVAAVLAQVVVVVPVFNVVTPLGKLSPTMVSAVPPSTPPSDGASDVTPVQGKC